MAQLAQPVEPFGEVNVYRQADGSIEIVATVLMLRLDEDAGAAMSRRH